MSHCGKSFRSRQFDAKPSKSRGRVGAALCSAAVAAECVKPLAPCLIHPTVSLLTIRFQIKISAPGAQAGSNWSNVMAAVQAFDRVEIIEEKAGYVHATITSMVFRFVDDLEVTLCEDGKQLAVRSSSRTGRWDLGVNLRRVEALVDRLRAYNMVRWGRDTPGYGRPQQSPDH